MGQADWKAENGEIVGTPKTAAGGWLILNKSYQDVQVAATFDHGERLMFLDSTLRQVTDRLGGIALGEDRKKTSSVANIDPNVPLEIGNHWYERMARASACRLR